MRSIAPLMAIAPKRVAENDDSLPPKLPHWCNALPIQYILFFHYAEFYL